MLYILWDLGLKVGHATRSVDECVRLSKSDLTIRTAILEARYLWGDRDLYDDLARRFDEDVVADTAREFIDMKLAERDLRHRRAGANRAIWSSPTSRTARVACAISTPCSGSPSTTIGTGRQPTWSRPASSPPRNTASSASARTSCGRCAATCTS
jgi:hypothetical protein